jgi:RNA polymerase sigma-70 factor (ECF subfamily)
MELLARWRAGDAESGNRLFERHFESVYRFFNHKVGAEAADLVQKTFLDCLEGRERFGGRSSFRTYLFAIARNELFAHYRARSQRLELDTASTSLHELSPSPCTLSLQRAADRLVLEALRTIPIDLQIVVELFYWEDLSGPEIAEVLGVAEGTARSRLRRAREALADRLRELEAGTEPPSTVHDLEAWAESLRRLRTAVLEGPPS